MKKLIVTVLLLCFVICLTACKEEENKNDVTDGNSKTASTEASAEDNNLSAEAIRKNIRGKCDGTFLDAKRIFEEEYPEKEFILEYFFTEKELKTIEVLEDNGNNRVFYETYDKGWVEIVSLIGEVGDEKVYIGEKDPFVKDFVWE